jgi:hypothetical protein
MNPAADVERTFGQLTEQDALFADVFDERLVRVLIDNGPGLLLVAEATMLPGVDSANRSIGSHCLFSF